MASAWRPISDAGGRRGAGGQGSVGRCQDQYRDDFNVDGAWKQNLVLGSSLSSLHILKEGEQVAKLLDA